MIELEQKTARARECLQRAASELEAAIATLDSIRPDSVCKSFADSIAFDARMAAGAVRACRDRSLKLDKAVRGEG